MATFTTTWWTNLVSNLLLSFFRCRKIVPEYYPRCRFRDNPKYDGISCRSSAGFSGEAMKNYKSLQAHHSSDRDSLGLFVEETGIAKFADSKRSELYKLHGRIIVFPSPVWEIFCIYPLFTHFTTMPSPRLIKAAKTVTILSILEIVVSSLASSVWLFKSCMGMVPWRIVYLFLSRPITRSTWIRTDDIFLEASTSWPPSCSFPLVKAGMMSWDPVMGAKSSCRVNPRSARIWSEWYWRLLDRKPDSLTSSTSETLPPQARDRKQIAPNGVQAISNLIVVCFL